MEFDEDNTQSRDIAVMEFDADNIQSGDIAVMEFDADNIQSGGASSNICGITSDMYVSSDSDDNGCTRQSPGGGKYYVPQCDIKMKPYVNQLFSSLDEGVNFYRDYGRTCGFDIRRGTERSCRGVVTIKYLLCHREGFCNAQKESDGGEKKLKRKRKNIFSRSGCSAKIALSFTSKGYRVRSFYEEHNHILVEKPCIQFLKSSRIMNDSHRSFVFNATKLNFGGSKAHTLMKEMTGAYPRIGPTSIDFKNFQRDLKLYIGHSDAQMIVDKFKDKQNTFEGFSFEYGVDESDCLTKLFWVDPIGKLKFSAFGDAVSFDATFRTNMYKMVFVPFIGVDNHKKCVTFGAGLLAKEDVEHYTWLLNAFVRPMGRKPLMIITDQCLEMKQAIPDVLGDETRHRLCMWHIMRKFPEKIKICTSDDCEFMKKIKKVIWNDEEGADVFERDWNTVISEFNLKDHVWLNGLYEIRRYWIPTYFRNEAMVGLLRTTSRSESENYFFSHFLRKGDTLCQFYMRFESAMDKQRQTNLKLNHESAISLPVTDTTLHLEKDAASIYTRTIFYEVQCELNASFVEILIQSCFEVDGIKIFSLKEKRKNDKVFKVTHNLSTDFVQCSCNMFERVGLLCRHCLFALNSGDVRKIPTALVRNRWTKNAEKRSSTLKIVDNCSVVETLDCKLNEIWFDVQTCFTIVGSKIDDVEFLHNEIKLLQKKMYDRVGDSNKKKNKNDFIETLIGSSAPSEVLGQVPHQSRNKGCGKRIKSSAEKSIKDQLKKSRKCAICGACEGNDKRNCPNKKSMTTNVEEKNLTDSSVVI